jgi:hypothetical protein
MPTLHYSVYGYTTASPSFPGISKCLLLQGLGALYF